MQMSPDHPDTLKYFSLYVGGDLAPSLGWRENIPRTKFSNDLF